MTIALGPLSFSVALLTTLAAILIGASVASRIAARRGIVVERSSWFVIAGAMLVARAAFALQYWSQYEAEPWRLIDIRDGGFRPLVGLTAAVVIGGWIAWRSAERRRALIAGVGSGALVWLLATGLATMAAPDQRLPVLTLSDLDGKPVPFAVFAGKPVVVNLWASWCPPCRREMPALMRAQVENPDVTFVFVNQGENAATIRQYLQAERLNLANLVLDPGGQMAGATKSPGLPTTLFFDAKGAMVNKRMGELSSATLAQRLAGVRSSVPARVD